MSRQPLFSMILTENRTDTCLQHSFSSCLSCTRGRVNASPGNWPRVDIIWGPLLGRRICLQPVSGRQCHTIGRLVSSKAPHEGGLQVVICQATSSIRPAVCLTAWQLSILCGSLQGLHSFIKITCSCSSSAVTKHLIAARLGCQLTCSGLLLAGCPTNNKNSCGNTPVIFCFVTSHRSLCAS